MKWIMRLIGVLLLIVVVAVGSLFLLPADRIAKIATDQLRKVTGREVTISGDVSMTFWPVLGVTAGQLEVGNADWAKDGAMLSTANAAIGVDAWSLLTGNIKITNIEAQSPTIRLEQRRDGRASWQFSTGSGSQEAEIVTETSPTREAKTITIQKLTITDATLIYDAEGADLVSYNGVDLALDWPENNGPADIVASLRPARDRVTVEATIDQFANFLTGTVQPIRARLSAKGGGFTLTGRGSLDGAVAGDLWFKTSDTAAFLGELGLGDVSVPAKLGRKADIKAQMTLTPDRRLALREVVADLGGNTLRGGADITLNGTPQVNATLSAGALDLTSVTGGGAPDSGGGGGGGASGAGWSKTPIDASSLASFNGEIALSADSIDLGSLKLGATRTLLTNDRARMVFTLRDVAAYGGKFIGEFVMNNRNGLSVGGNLNARGVDMQPLLIDMADLNRFSGKGDADLSFLGTGQSVDAIIRSLSGNGAVNVGRGAIEGIDLDKLLGSFDVEGGTTVFDSLTANFVINSGVLRNDDLLMLLPNFNATGSGQVNLGAQTLDYTVVPKALRINGERGLAVPVRISGPWADPSIKPDLGAAVDLNFAAEKKEAEERVRQKLQEKLQEELGVARQEGQSAEEAVRDELEDKLKRELFKIFD